MNALDWKLAELRYQHTQAIYTQLLERYSPSATNKMMAALSQVLEEAGADVSGGLPPLRSRVERKTGQRLLKGRALSIGEVQALFNVCAQDESIKCSRDAALIAVLYGAGLRRSEVVAMDLVDWNE